MSSAGRTEENEMSPEALADILSLTTGVMIPAVVIATWTQAERDDDALEWAAAEHLSASDNAGVRRVPQPPFVHRAAEVCASPAMAQVAVDSWITCKEIVRVPGVTGDPAESAIAGAQMAITGLLVLLGPGWQAERPTWQRQALEVLGEHPEGVRAIDLFALLGRAVPSQHALEEWLAAGQSTGILAQVAHEVWAVRDPAGGTVRRQRPEGRRL
jgi:hypothetical protein